MVGFKANCNFLVPKGTLEIEGHFHWASKSVTFQFRPWSHIRESDYIVMTSRDLGFCSAKSQFSLNPMLKEGLTHYKEWISGHLFKDLLSLVWSIQYVQCGLLLPTGFIFCTLEAPVCLHKANYSAIYNFWFVQLKVFSSILWFCQ